MPRNGGACGPSAAKQPRTTFSPRAVNASFTSTTSSADSMSGGRLRHSRDGEITKIKLSDFMNHAELDLKLSPGVNVITGLNGAGKSSILQAIVLGLGAAAKDTKRGRNLSEFIRHGCQKTEIKVHLYNGGDESYRQETFGKEIIFQRTITPSHSTHVLKDDKGRTVYEKSKLLCYYQL